MSTKAKIREAKERGFLHGICGLPKQLVPAAYAQSYACAYDLGASIGDGRAWLRKALKVHVDQEEMHRMLERSTYGKSRREPCYGCRWAALCKATERTCEAFRAYCGEFVNRDNPPRVPDMHWSESWDLRR